VIVNGDAGMETTIEIPGGKRIEFVTIKLDEVADPENQPRACIDLRLTR
jgi:hypothetical protein